MTTQTWEKPIDNDRGKITSMVSKSGGRWKFMVGGLLILASIGYLIITTTLTNASFFITVEEITSNPQEYIGRTVRVSGAVIGETIVSDTENLTLNFTISHIPTEFDNLAVALHNSVTNPDLARIPIFVENQVKPDLLQHEAQAILTGTLQADGIFYADELLLKCPSRFEDGSSNPALGQDHPEIANAG